MNNIVLNNEEQIENMIYEIRGKQVMLDSDLAKLYHVETKRINEAVRRNKEKFPEKFSWRLNDVESKNFLVAICDQKSIETRGGKYMNPRVFTEQGVAMLRKKHMNNLDRVFLIVMLLLLWVDRYE
ncbi:MAG: ORF6N domain-containing protein [Firmicutes bacterium]|nr:ORF6N domain-containing protein [Bacillota bacterium]